jgi:DNA-binding transcriptional MerR regulator
VASTPTTGLISSGEFARRTRLSPKALRIYQRVGLLRPVAVEPNGYRRYDPAQVPTGRLIAMLRGADVSLAEIGLLLGELERGAEPAVERLEQLLAARQREHVNRQLLIRHIQAILRTGEDSMYAINVRHVPAIRVMSIARRLYAHETDGFAREAKAMFLEHLGGAETPGPFTLIFHGVVSHESDGPLEAVLPCPDEVQPTDLIGVRTEPAHDEAYTTITKAQWRYPAILAAYDAVACSPEVQARSHSPLSCREVYIAEPDTIGDQEPICDIAFPLGAPEESETVVERANVPIMFRRATEDQAAITRAWADLEEVVASLDRRKFYGLFDPGSREPLL